MRTPSNDPYRRFALQAAVLALSALVLFWLVYAADFFLSPLDRAAPFGPLSRYLDFDPEGLSDTIATLVAVNTAVFGIVITVVSIIVQLAAERYTGVARMFLRDRINIYVAAYYVISSVASVWLAASLQSDFVPRTTLVLLLCMTMGGLVITMPYFGYVFWFLAPENLVRRIRQDAIKIAEKGACEQDRSDCHTAQAGTLFALEELTDIANNSISGKDKIIASAAADALKDFAIEYLKVKPRASEAWFSIGAQIRQNPDFVAMDAESLADLEARRTWVEWKVMRQFLSIYIEALSSMRDVTGVIAIDTRYIGEAAIRAKDSELTDLVFRFMNSYLRATLNARDVRAAYNVLNQYRKLAESMLVEGSDRASTAAKHMKYYGLLGYELDLNFVTETAAYDLSSLTQLANELGSAVEPEILSEFLELDRAPLLRGQDRALLGVRKAQVKLAAYYLSTGQESKARAIAADMRGEPEERLRKIGQQLEAVESKDFWEIIDRGRNFEYMPPAQREHVATFIGWLRNAEALAGERSP